MIAYLHKYSDPSPPFAQFDRAASSTMSLGSSKLLRFLRIMEVTVFLDLQCCRKVLIPFHGSVPRHNAVLELYKQFLRSHCLVFALICTVNCGTIFAPEWRSGLRHCISVLEASLQTPCFKSKLYHNLPLLGVP
jgi:hypothetical protein